MLSIPWVWELWSLVTIWHEGYVLRPLSLKLSTQSTNTIVFTRLPRPSAILIAPTSTSTSLATSSCRQNSSRAEAMILALQSFWLFSLREAWPGNFVSVSSAQPALVALLRTCHSEWLEVLMLKMPRVKMIGLRVIFLRGLFCFFAFPFLALKSNLT